MGLSREFLKDYDIMYKKVVKPSNAGKQHHCCHCEQLIDNMKISCLGYKGIDFKQTIFCKHCWQKLVQDKVLNDPDKDWKNARNLQFVHEDLKSFKKILNRLCKQDIIKDPVEAWETIKIFTMEKNYKAKLSY